MHVWKESKGEISTRFKQTMQLKLNGTASEKSCQGAAKR